LLYPSEAEWKLIIVKDAAECGLTGASWIKSLSALERALVLLGKEMTTTEITTETMVLDKERQEPVNKEEEKTRLLIYLFFFEKSANYESDTNIRMRVAR
jgi:hypothetical protein